ncbi:MAG: flagellar biosynthetic protein FliO [Rhodospirillales bacterium]
MDMDGYFRFILALVFVLGLIAVLAAMARKAGWGFPSTAIKRAGNRRLGVVEVTPLDGRRRLILVRRDDVEHLLLIGPTSELVIEAGIPGNGSADRTDSTSFKNTLETVSRPPSQIDGPEGAT